MERAPFINAPLHDRCHFENVLILILFVRPMCWPFTIVLLPWLLPIASNWPIQY